MNSPDQQQQELLSTISAEIPLLLPDNILASKFTGDAELMMQTCDTSGYFIPTDFTTANTAQDCDLDETTSIGRMDREIPISENSFCDDDNCDDSSSDENEISSDDDIFIDENFMNLVQSMIFSSDFDEGNDNSEHLDVMMRTEHEVKDDQLHITKVDDLPLPSAQLLAQVEQNQPLIPGLQPIGTIMNLFSNNAILKPWGAKSDIFTDSSDDDSDDNTYDNPQHRNNTSTYQSKNNPVVLHGMIQPVINKPKSNAGGTIATPDDLASLTTLQLQTPVFNYKGQGIGRLSDILGHVQFPFFVISFHNETIILEDLTCEDNNKATGDNATLYESHLNTIDTNPSTTCESQSTACDDQDDDQSVVISQSATAKINQHTQNQQTKSKKLQPPKKPKEQIKPLPIPKLNYGDTLYFLPSLTHAVATAALLGKGTDASNRWDEEAKADDNDVMMGFSDDEEEAAFKQRQKHAKLQKKNQLNNQNEPPSSKNHDNQQNTNGGITQKKMGSTSNIISSNNKSSEKQDSANTMRHYQPKAYAPIVMTQTAPQSTQPSNNPTNSAPPSPYSTNPFNHTPSTLVPPPPPSLPAFGTNPQQSQQWNSAPSTTNNGVFTSTPQDAMMFQQYQLLSQNQVPLTPHQQQHFQFLMASFATQFLSMQTQMQSQPALPQSNNSSQTNSFLPPPPPPM